MRIQLQKFTDFASTLLPHETEYLLSIQQFKDENRLDILKRVDYNAHFIDQFMPYDTSIDKRKYNHLKNWIQDQLNKADQDKHFNKILDFEQKIMTDAIQLEEEKQLLKWIKNYQHPTFFFTKFYETVEQYRHFLLIRLSYSDHQLVDNFVKKHREAYLLSKEVQEKLHKATLDIVGQYSGESKESWHWEEWLTEIFYNENLEGQIRYLALIRLAFINHNYKKYDSLQEKFDYLDKKYSQGLFYSKRFLLNYYSNCLLLYSSFQDYDKAVYYGYLSIRAKNHDHLFYVNNLCAVLLRLNRNQEALELMKKALPEVKKTKNFHTRVGFVAFYMEALIKNGLYKNAESYGFTFLKVYGKEVLKFRWHLFFSVYLESMLHQLQYEKLLRVTQKYKLEDRDKFYRKKANYIPLIPIYIEVARFKEGIISKSEFIKNLEESIKKYQYNVQKPFTLKHLMKLLESWLPEINTYFREHLLKIK